MNKSVVCVCVREREKGMMAKTIMEYNGIKKKKKITLRSLRKKFALSDVELLK